MSFLYPRLLAEQAKPLFEEYRHLPVAELTGRTGVAHDSAVYVATGGDRVSPAQLKELRAGVVDLAKDAGFPDDSDRVRNADFDLRLLCRSRNCRQHRRARHEHDGLAVACVVGRDHDVDQGRGFVGGDGQPAALCEVFEH